MNEVAELTVQYVNQPKEGKKWGSIKSSEGDSYFGPPALLREFSVGEVAKVEWKPFGQDAKAIVKKLFNGEIKPKQVVRPSTSKSDSEQIWCTAHSKSVIAMFIGDDLKLDRVKFTQLTNDLRACFAATFGGSTAQRRDDLNDEIPY